MSLKCRTGRGVMVFFNSLGHGMFAFFFFFSILDIMQNLIKH